MLETPMAFFQFPIRDPMLPLAMSTLGDVLGTIFRTSVPLLRLMTENTES